MTKIFKQLGRHWAACLAVVALLDSVAEVRWAARSTRSSGRRRIREQPPLPLKSARKFAKISPLRCKKAGCL